MLLGIAATGRGSLQAPAADALDKETIFCFSGKCNNTSELNGYITSV